MATYAATSSSNTAHAAIAATWDDGAGRLSPREEGVLPAKVVCVGVPAPAPAPAPTAVAFPADEAAVLPGSPLAAGLAAGLGTNGTPFIIACTAMPSPTLIQSS